MSAADSHLPSARAADGCNFELAWRREIYAAWQKHVPTMLVEITNGNWDGEEADKYIDNLETVMGTDNPDGLKIILESLGDDKAKEMLELKAEEERGADENPPAVGDTQQNPVHQEPAQEPEDNNDVEAGVNPQN